LEGLGLVGWCWRVEVSLVGVGGFRSGWLVLEG
jgi:hypothetical protein